MQRRAGVHMHATRKLNKELLSVLTAVYRAQHRSGRIDAAAVH